MNTLSTAATLPIYATNQLPPAQLWIANSDVILEHVLQFLQQQFCLHAGCGICATCRAISNQQFHAVTWIAPSNTYTLDDLTEIHSTIAFALEANTHHFFIIHKADVLTAQCANSLLKTLEEPPAGYHFILLAQREDLLLPTVRSRCITHYFAGSALMQSHQQLWHIFTQLKFEKPVQFLKDLEQNKINEQESIDLIDRLLLYWIEQVKKCAQSENAQESKIAERMVLLFKHALLKPPMPGSSSIFWKNLFLQSRILQQA